MRRHVPSALAIALAAGCVTTIEPSSTLPGDGIADISWQVGAQGCAAGGVTEVSVAVADQVVTAPCDDGSLMVDLPEGTWDIVVEAFDAAGVARYSGEALGIRIVGGDVTVVPTVILGANPAELTVTWYFENGRLCGGNGVVGLDVTLFDDDYIVEEVQTTCDDGIELLQGLVAGEYSLLVLGRDDTGTALFQGDQVVVLEKGANVAADVLLVAL